MDLKSKIESNILDKDEDNNVINISKSLENFKNENLDQKVTREEALKMFTIWPAIAAFEEDIRGTLEVGKLADITVFNKDLMTIPEEEIMSAKNILTILDGKIIYQDL